MADADLADRRPVPTVMRLRGLFLRVAVSAVLGLVFHVAWLVVFIFSASRGAPLFVKVLLWLLAPVISGAGFALGLSLVGHGVPRRRTGFGTAFRITLIGCAIGAAVMSPLGPMVVGFGVLAGGSMAVVTQCFADERGMRVWSTPRQKDGRS